MYRKVLRCLMFVLLLVSNGGLAAQPTLAALQPFAPMQPASHSLRLPLVVNWFSPKAPPAHPLTISVSLDSSRAVSAPIPVAGGTLTVTAANGTLFTLSIPPNALLSPEKITMTPVSASAGLPVSGGLVAGVQLAPEGLRLLQAATLTLTLTASVPLSQQIAFGYHGSGSEFHLHPLQSDPAGVILKLVHFSGYGLGQGTQADVSTQVQQHPPTSSGDQLDQQAAAGLDRAYKNYALNQGWINIVDPDLQIAQNDDEELDVALGVFLVWLSNVQQAGLDQQDPFAFNISVGWNYLALGLVNAVDKAYQRCVGSRDPTQVLTIMRWAFEASAKPELQAAVGSQRLAAMKDKARKCATFELDFDSTISLNSSSDVSPAGSHSESNWNAHLASKVPMVVDSFFTDSDAVAPLNYRSFSYIYHSHTHTQGDPPGTFEDCTGQEAGKQDGGLQVKDFLIDLNIVPESTPVIVVNYSFAPEPTETTTISCTGPHGNYTLTDHANDWATAFDFLHNYSFSAGDWTAGSAPVYTRKSYNRSRDCGSSGTTCAESESTALELVHTPQR